MNTAIPKASQADVEALKARRVARQNRMRVNGLREAYTRQLVTPEGAELNLTLANAAVRLGAFVIDFLVFVGLMILVVVFAAFNAEANWFNEDDSANITLALLIVIWFLLRNFYWIFFEAGRRAATPGKRILGLRVVARDGGHLSLGAILARNFSREIEVFLPISIGFGVLGAGEGLSLLINLLLMVWVGCFLFFPVFNKDKLRLGDLIAGTYVIRAPKTKLLADISQKAAETAKTQTDAQPETPPEFRFTTEQLNAYGIHELQVLEGVLRNKNQTALPKVAEKIRAKISYGYQIDDRTFLEAYYKALRQHLESGLLMGKRKEDKFDT